jgi:hypothetical protein
LEDCSRRRAGGRAGVGLFAGMGEDLDHVDLEFAVVLVV